VIPSDLTRPRICRKEFVIFVGFVKKLRSGMFSMRAPRENTMGKNSGRGGAVPCNKSLTICRGV